MNISPKVGVWFNILVGLAGLIAGGTIYFGHLTPDQIGDIKGYAGDFIAASVVINGVLHLYSAPTAGPLAKG